MKKLLLLSVLAVFAIASCKKKDKNVSTTVTASSPTITFTNGMFYSIRVGGLRPTVAATAYDSFYKQSYDVVITDNTINNLVPGLYTGTVSAKNLYGFIGSATYFVAVTNVSDSMDISGHWWQVPFADSTATDIYKLANGLYATSNLQGVNIYTDPTNVMSAYFAVLDNTTIAFDPVTVSSGILSSDMGILDLTPITGDTSINYMVAGVNTTFYRK